VFSSLWQFKGRKLEFVQVGANDGCLVDPLRKYILKFPWHGIVIEPQPDVFARLCSNYDAVRERLIFENVAIADGVGLITMYRAKICDSQDEAYASSVASMNPEVTAKMMHLRRSQLEPLSVRCTTLDKLISQHGMARIDILQIDAEGQDFSVLKTLDLSTIAPLIVQLEHGGLSPTDVDLLVQYLSRNGYRILFGGRQQDTVALNEAFPLD
jgi:FkbM family methyltransferase